MRELLRTRHFAVAIDDDAGVLCRARTAERFASIDEVEAAYAQLLEAMAPLARAELGQLVDAREAPPRNDPAFEAVVTRHHRALYRGFRATAVLVRSAVGKLHVMRMLEASGVDASVFVDEGAALAHLRRPARP